MQLILVIDYVRGARCGQRQIIDPLERVSFGRHPDNLVVFDAQADIDSSSRHAELVKEEGEFILRDIGSSNGTWVAGKRFHQRTLEEGEALEVEFGKGGPVLRLWLGADATHAPSPVLARRGLRRFLPW